MAQSNVRVGASQILVWAQSNVSMGASQIIVTCRKKIILYVTELRSKAIRVPDAVVVLTKTKN